MSISEKMFLDWELAVSTRKAMQVNVIPNVAAVCIRWAPPEFGWLKLNTDTAIRVGSDSFSIGLVLRDHSGSFVAGKVASFSGNYTVLEAEVSAIYEGLKWLGSLPYQQVVVESDSLLAVQAIRSSSGNLLEVGHIVESCRTYIRSRAGFSISFVKRQANKAAHVMARSPCLLNCQIFFTIPPSSMQETLVSDSSFL